MIDVEGRVHGAKPCFGLVGVALPSTTELVSTTVMPTSSDLCLARPHLASGVDGQE